MKIRYIGSVDLVGLDREKIYEVLSVERGWYRIMTELDEDYIFPPDLFEVVEQD